MKKFLAIAFVLAMVVFSSLPVLAADDGTVGKFTPIIDGVKDEAYDISYSIGIFDQEGVTKGQAFNPTFGKPATTLDAKAYYLWDDKYLYIYVDVTGEYLGDIGAQFIEETANPWESTSVEMWTIWTDINTASERVKTSTSAYHSKFWGDGPYFEEVAAGSTAVTKLKDNGYTAEFKLAIPGGLKDGQKLKVTLQVNDYSEDDKGTNAVGQQISDSTIDILPILDLGTPIVIEVFTEPETAPPTVAETTILAPAEITAVAPQTGDNTVAMLALIVITASVFAVIRHSTKVKQEHKQ